MTVNDWDKVKWFSVKEFNEPLKMHKDLIFRLDYLRYLTGKAITIKSSYRRGSKGYHGKGMAVDISIDGMNCLDAFFWATRIDKFNGIGIYPNWATPGLHLDIRPFTAEHEHDSRWVGLLEFDKNGNARRDAKGNLIINYMPLNWAVLKDFIK